MLKNEIKILIQAYYKGLIGAVFTYWLLIAICGRIWGLLSDMEGIGIGWGFAPYTPITDIPLFSLIPILVALRLPIIKAKLLNLWHNT